MLSGYIHTQTNEVFTTHWTHG